MTDSRPLHVEIERRKLIEEMTAAVGDTTEYRIKNAEVLADIRADLRYGGFRMEAHEDRLTKLETDIKDWNDAKAQATGAKKLIIGAAVVLSAIGGGVMFVIDMLSRVKPLE